MGSRHPSIAPFEAFKTKDSFLIIAAGNDKLFKSLCEVLEIPNIANDEMYKTNSLRSQNIDKLKLIIEDKLQHKNTDEWIKVIGKFKNTMRSDF